MLWLIFFIDMAVPKKKIARSRGKVRHSHYVKTTQKRILDETKVVKCASCGEAKLSHRVCPECGQYKGRQVVVQKEAETTRIQA